MHSSSSPKRPLLPTFRIERARIEEHNRLYAEARKKWEGHPVCPDCFNPPHLCGHMNLKLKP